jgi:hypothetical protein
MARRRPLAAAAQERNKLACGSALETGSHGRVCCWWRRPSRQAAERVRAREVRRVRCVGAACVAEGLLKGM